MIFLCKSYIKRVGGLSRQPTAKAKRHVLPNVSLCHVPLGTEISIFLFPEKETVGRKQAVSVLYKEKLESGDTIKHGPPPCI